MNTPEEIEGLVKNKTTLIILLIIVVIMIIVPLIFTGGSKDSDSLSKKEIAGDNSNLRNSREVLRLMFDDYTPCNVPINYKFKLDTQGDPISLKFPGIDETIYYSGKGTIKVPPRRSGNVLILSLDSTKQARVRIWKVIKINNN